MALAYKKEIRFTGQFYDGKKGSGSICRNGPKGAAHQLNLTASCLVNCRPAWTVSRRGEPAEFVLGSRVRNEQRVRECRRGRGRFCHGSSWSRRVSDRRGGSHCGCRRSRLGIVPGTVPTRRP